MVRCPVCESTRVVVIIAPERRALCSRCSTRWIQDGDRQRAIVRGTPPAEAGTAAVPSPREVTETERV
jgi:hypothetical protein